MKLPGTEIKNPTARLALNSARTFEFCRDRAVEARRNGNTERARSWANDARLCFHAMKQFAVQLTTEG